MATPDRRLTYGSYTEKYGFSPTKEAVEDGFVMCACGATLKPEEFEYYRYQCERCENRTVLSNITEIPVGKYDAVRTLRHVLAIAEKGEIDDVVIVCQKRGPEGEGDDHWATWSDLRRHDVWWLVGWLTAYIHRRYFHGQGSEERDDD